MKREDALAIVNYVSARISASEDKLIYKALDATAEFFKTVVDSSPPAPPPPVVPRGSMTFIGVMLECGHTRMINADLKRNAAFYCDSCRCFKNVGVGTL